MPVLCTARRFPRYISGYFLSATRSVLDSSPQSSHLLRYSGTIFLRHHHQIKQPKKKEQQITQTDYIFQQIGFSIPLNPNSSKFNLQNPPTQASAVSQNPNFTPLIFLTHSSVLRISADFDNYQKRTERDRLAISNKCTRG